jgi:cytoskeletal protein CcmA (bactofilin family)
VFNKKRNDERDRPEASYNEASPEPNEPIIQAEPDMQASDPDPAQYANGNGGAAKPSVNNLKPSIISEGFTFEGTITSDGVLNIAGTVRGKITAKSVLIDSSGQVDGELNSEQLVIKGQLKGDVNCDDLNVGPLARVDGNISYKYIHIQRGGRVAGRFIKG